MATRDSRTERWRCLSHGLSSSCGLHRAAPSPARTPRVGAAGRDPGNPARSGAWGEGRNEQRSGRNAGRRAVGPAGHSAVRRRRLRATGTRKRAARSGRRRWAGAGRGAARGGGALQLRAAGGERCAAGGTRARSVVCCASRPGGTEAGGKSSGFPGKDLAWTASSPARPERPGMRRMALSPKEGPAVV